MQKVYDMTIGVCTGGGGGTSNSSPRKTENSRSSNLTTRMSMTSITSSAAPASQKNKTILAYALDKSPLYGLFRSGENDAFSRQERFFYLVFFLGMVISTKVLLSYVTAVIYLDSTIGAGLGNDDYVYVYNDGSDSMMTNIANNNTTSGNGDADGDGDGEERFPWEDFNQVLKSASNDKGLYYYGMNYFAHPICTSAVGVFIQAPIECLLRRKCNYCNRTVYMIMLAITLFCVYIVVFFYNKLEDARDDQGNEFLMNVGILVGLDLLVFSTLILVVQKYVCATCCCCGGGCKKGRGSQDKSYSQLRLSRV
mmetsp:Transcript_10476/g.15289  ORF Transcript_10476/g.15289 Transcript_10476/m.15289 type:complete len:310 (+) Transcript_10476:132-1061(+)